MEKIKAISLGYSTARPDRQADELANARNALVAKKEEALPYAKALLLEGEIALRVNGAMVLAAMARSGVNTPELLQSLTQCLNDSNNGVVRWGLDGILRTLPPDVKEADIITLSDRVAALRQCLDLSKPRALRVSAVMVLDERKPRYAIPILIAYLQALLPEYTAQVEQKLTVEETRSVDPAAAPAAPAAPGAPSVLGAAPAVRRVKRRIDPGLLVDTELTTMIAKMESAPAVAELHYAGVVMEEIIRREYRGEKLELPDAHFDNQPPWELKRCVEWVVNGWMPKHADDFKDIPSAAAPAPAPAPAPAAAPAAETPAAPAKPPVTTTLPAPAKATPPTTRGAPAK